MYLLLWAVSLGSSLAAAEVSRGDTVVVQKCCKRHEILVDDGCRDAWATKESVWEPEFYEKDGVTRAKVKDFVVITGVPSCGSHQPWPIYHNFSDKLVLLRDGSLRHILYHDTHIEDAEVLKEYDYKINLYCFEKKYDTNTNKVSQYALVCAPEVPVPWLETYLIQKVFVRVCYSITTLVFLVLLIISLKEASILKKVHVFFFVSLVCHNTAAFVNTFHEYFTDETVLTFGRHTDISRLNFLGKMVTSFLSFQQSL